MNLFHLHNPPDQLSLPRPGLPLSISYPLVSKNPLAQNIPFLGKIFPIAAPDSPEENPNLFEYHKKIIQKYLA
jgi:hypothetical protein